MKNEIMKHSEFKKAVSLLQDDIMLIEAKGSLNNMQIIFNYKNEKMTAVQSIEHFDISFASDSNLYKRVEKMDDDEVGHFLELLSSAAYLEVSNEVMPKIGYLEDFMSIEMKIKFTPLMQEAI
ncbi:hypothetical protein [Vreelandella neptunia]|uniref:Uncharacterized protein n=1 Tax=Vreelandella neptunia TaxID=115551 RepID=A0ABS9SAK3_9GAMM|nr:hypothetical protein [Halomonas neptunia]MCH4813125.1 hypothetical protein [Halomonas neptunia]